MVIWSWNESRLLFWESKRKSKSMVHFLTTTTWKYVCPDMTIDVSRCEMWQVTVIHGWRMWHVAKLRYIWLSRRETKMVTTWPLHVINMHVFGSFGGFLSQLIRDFAWESFAGVCARGLIPMYRRYGAELRDRGSIFYPTIV